MNAQMLDPKQVPAYVRQDYWWRPGSFFEPLYNVTLPYLAGGHPAPHSAPCAHCARVP